MRFFSRYFGIATKDAHFQLLREKKPYKYDLVKFSVDYCNIYQVIPEYF